MFAGVAATVGGVAGFLAIGQPSAGTTNVRFSILVPLVIGLVVVLTVSVVTAACSAAGAVVLARVVLARFDRCGVELELQRVQSGVINDYVTWIVTGLACLGGALALIVR